MHIHEHLVCHSRPGQPGPGPGSALADPFHAVRSGAPLQLQFVLFISPWQDLKQEPGRGRPGRPGPGRPCLAPAARDPARPTAAGGNQPAAGG